MDSIGRYRPQRQLGAGAFATVWLAQDDELDVPVAVKVLADNWATNADVRRRFVEEARALRRCGDPRVVGVHDIGSLPDGRPYFVMDYADAGTVAELVAGRVEPARALQIGVDTARAVQVLHDQGILHRDVKPSNLLRHDTSRGERLMIADLGMAKALAEASGLTMTAGTPAYMAPEQARGLPLDQRADVYGVAGVVYALIVGSPPFPTPGGMTDVLSRTPHTRPAPIGGPLGPALDDILGGALAFDREDRPNTAGEFADQLQSVLTDLLRHPDPGPTILRPPAGRAPSLAAGGGSAPESNPMTVAADATTLPTRPAIPDIPTPVRGSGAEPVAPHRVLRPAALAGLAVSVFLVTTGLVWLILRLLS